MPMVSAVPRALPVSLIARLAMLKTNPTPSAKNITGHSARGRKITLQDGVKPYQAKTTITGTSLTKKSNIGWPIAAMTTAFSWKINFGDERSRRGQARCAGG